MNKTDKIRSVQGVQRIEGRIHHLSRRVYDKHLDRAPTSKHILHTLHNALRSLGISVRSDRSQNFVRKHLHRGRTLLGVNSVLFDEIIHYT